MKKKYLSLCIGILFLLCGTGLGEEVKQAQKKLPALDVFDLILMFMVPASQPDNLIPWEKAVLPGSSIEWETDVRLDPYPKGDVRLGEAMVTINGEPLSTFWGSNEPAPACVR